MPYCCGGADGGTDDIADGCGGGGAIAGAVPVAAIGREAAGAAAATTLPHFAQNRDCESIAVPH